MRGLPRLLLPFSKASRQIRSNSILPTTAHLKSYRKDQAYGPLKYPNAYLDRCQATKPSELLPSSQKRRLGQSLKDLHPERTYLVGVAISEPARVYTQVQVHKLLLLKRADIAKQFPGLWCVPGGHIEVGETVEQAIQRETFEETGLVVEDVLGEFGELNWISQNGKRNVQLNFAATVEHSEGITLSAREHSAWMWAAKEDLAALPCSMGMAKVIQDALRYTTQGR